MTLRRLSLPKALAVVVLASGAVSCSGTPSNEDGGTDGGNTDAGPTEMCPQGCYNPTDPDGGPGRYEDGGLICYC
jgi:hypothetical protein